MQPLCQSSQLSRSLESELENAVKTGELKLSAKNLKDFPRHGERYNLQDTLLAGNYRGHFLGNMQARNIYFHIKSICHHVNVFRRVFLKPQNGLISSTSDQHVIFYGIPQILWGKDEMRTDRDKIIVCR